MSVFLFQTFFISVSKTWNIETMLTFPYSYNWQKFNKKMNKKRIQEYQSMNPEYMYLGKLIIVFWSFFWDNFVVWFLHRLNNPNML